ncbi:MAG: hypothetical protein CVV27_00255 [Candidatus Melainabacteria bacterium HGW-Melainabacteria-1]|nr:MAG: hypothetical protein CVV27_00255 [Candidatus Melainabacteria bacterium HGW-Melainabacteria-1]
MLETKQEMDIFSIRLPQGASPDEARVQFLADSIRENGLISPIAVSPDNALLAGFHRLMAFQKLYQEDGDDYRQIAVRVVDKGDSSHLQQLETSEKLFHPQLTILEKAEHFKEYFNELKYGQNRHKTTAIFRTLDISRRTFFNLRAIAERLGGPVRERILNSELRDLANSTPQLLALSKYDEASQLEILEIMAKQGCGTIFEASRLFQEQAEQPAQRKARQKFLKSPSLKLDKDLRQDLAKLAQTTGIGQNELFNEIFEAGLELMQQKYVQ